MRVVRAEGLDALNVALAAATTERLVGAVQVIGNRRAGASDAVYFATLEGDPTEAEVDVTISSTELLALNATPKTLVAAPGAGYALVPLSIQLFLDYNSAAYSGVASGEDLALKYTNASGAILATIETDPFLTSTADAYRFQFPVTTTITPVDNAALVLHLLSGEVAAGNSPLRCRVRYRRITLAF